MIRGIIDLLVSNATVAGLVGQFEGKAKIFPVVAPQKDFKRPYVTVRRVSAEGTIAKSQAADKDQTLVNIVAYADDYKKCIDILSACRDVLDDYKGTSKTVVYHRIWYNSSQDMFDKDDNSLVIVDSYFARTVRVKPA